MRQLSIIKQMFEALSDEEKANFVAYLKGGTQKNSKPLGNLAQLILSHNHAERPEYGNANLPLSKRSIRKILYWQERNNGVIISVSNTRKIMLMSSFSASSNMKGVFLCRKEYTLKRQTFGGG